MPFQNPLSAAALAAAIATTTLTVTGQVSTTPTTSTDEDEVRSYTQAQINALTAADKQTNFVIYNKTTGAINYCVDANIVVPPSPSAIVGSGRYSLNFSIPAAYTTYSIDTGVTGLKRVWFGVDDDNGYQTIGFDGFCGTVAAHAHIWTRVNQTQAASAQTNGSTDALCRLISTGGVEQQIYVKNAVLDNSSGTTKLTLQMRNNSSSASATLAASHYLTWQGVG